MEYEIFLDHIRRRAGSTEDAAREAAEATLEAFGSLIPRKDRRLLASQLPREFSAAVQNRQDVRDLTPEEFYEDIKVGDPNTAYNIEHAQAVLETVGEAIDQEMFRRISRRVHKDFEELLTPKEVPEAERIEGRVPRDDDGRKLSTGRSGSSRPLAESKGNVHSESVAASDNPHGERKLSTGKGPSPERTLSEGEEPEGGPDQPTPKEPVVESEQDKGS